MSVSQHVRFAIRRLIRERTFAAASVATIAIGVAATTSIFAVVNGVVARPLPYAGADRLVHLISHGMEGTTPRRSWVMSLPYFTAVRERATTLSAIGGYDSFSSVT